MLNRGKPEDVSKAFSWFKKAAQQGWSEAQFNLGTCYSFGFGIEKDIEKANSWFDKASKRGVNQVTSSNVVNRTNKIKESSQANKNDMWIRNWSDVDL